MHPGLHLLEHESRLCRAQAGPLLRRRGLRVDSVEVLDPSPYDQRRRKVVTSLFIATVHVRPATGQRQTLLAACARDVRRGSVADDCSRVVADEGLEGRRRFVVADLMVDQARRAEAPHLPGRQRLVLKVRPARLIEPDHRTGAKLLEDRIVGRRQQVGHRRALVPQGLRRDIEAVVRHRAHLALEGEVIDVLVERDLDGEAQRVTAAFDGALGTRSRLDRRAALADIFLPLDLGDHVLDVHDVDHLGRLALSLHRHEPASAFCACASGVVERAAHGNAFETKLLLGTVAATRTVLRGGLAVSLVRGLLGCGARGSLDSVGDRGRFLACRLDERERPLQLTATAFELLQLCALLRVNRDQVLELRLLKKRNLPEPLDVGLAFEINHDAK